MCDDKIIKNKLNIEKIIIIEKRIIIAKINFHFYSEYYFLANDTDFSGTFLQQTQVDARHLANVCGVHEEVLLEQGSIHSFGVIRLDKISVDSKITG